MRLTNERFVTISRSLAHGILTTCHNKKYSNDDTAAICGASLVEALGQTLGPLGAVERLRDLADLLERDLMREVI